MSEAQTALEVACAILGHQPLWKRAPDKLTHIRWMCGKCGSITPLPHGWPGDPEIFIGNDAAKIYE